MLARLWNSSLQSKLGRGMREAMVDTGCARGYVVHAGRDAFPLADNVDATPLARFVEEVALPRFGPQAGGPQ